MKRGLFIKRLLGLAATAAVAPQVLADRVHETEVPGVGGTTFQFPLRKDETVQFTAIPARPHEIWVDGNGRSWYITGVKDNVITMTIVDNHMRRDGELTQQIHPPYHELRDMVCMYSAIPERSI